MYSTSPDRGAAPAAARRLLLSASALALLAALATSGSAIAANYTAGNEADLVLAIANANASPDANATITLTADFTITGTLPEVTTALTIDSGAFTLKGHGNQPLNVSASGALTIVGKTIGTAPNNSGQGRLRKQGAGTATLTGVTGNYFGGITVEGGTLRIDGGSQIVMGNPVSDGSVLMNVGGPATLIISGQGTTVTARNGTGSLGTSVGATMTVQAGATYDQGTPGFVVGSVVGDKGTLNVDGVGSLFKGGILNVGAGQGVVNVASGGKIATGTVSVGGLAALDRGGTGKLLVSGQHSRWDNSGTFSLLRGSLDVLGGGVVQTSILRLAVANDQVTTIANVRVSGVGSELIATSAVANAFQIAGGNKDSVKTGRLTIANGGKVTVGAVGAGTINMATGTGSRAVLNIGGAEGEAATAAGTLSAAKLAFGPGTSVVNFNHTDAAYGFNVGLEGNATINQIGSGKTILATSQTAFTGKTNVLAGILEVNDTLGGTMDVLGGRLQGTGTVGATRNAVGGTIAPGKSSGTGTLTIAGDYTGNGGALEIEAILGDDNSDADLLLISGNSVLLGLAPTLVTVINVGGLGGETVNGIKIVEVQGATSDAGAFVLNGPAIGGAYSYKLFQNDLDTGLDGDWYLRSDKLAPTTPTFENYPVALLGMIDLPTLRQRVGDRTEAADTIWTRIEGAAGHYEASDSSTGAAYDSSAFLAQIGLERPLLANADGTLIAGLTAQYGRHTADVFSSFGDGSNFTESLGVGASLTWRGTDGTYADLQGQFAGFSTDLDAVGYSLVEDNAGTGFAVGLEVGHQVKLDDAWALTPQAQFSYASVDFDSFTDRFGSEIALESGDSLIGRLGLALDYQTDWQDAEGRAAATKLYGIANATYEFLDGAAVVVSGTGLNYAGQKFAAELGLGGTMEWADGAQSLHGELLGASSFEGSYAVKGTVGFTGKF